MRIENKTKKGQVTSKDFDYAPPKWHVDFLNNIFFFRICIGFIRSKIEMKNPE